MSKPLGVKANLSFGSYRIGRVYEVDLDDVTVLSLLGVGYLSPIDEDKGGEDADMAGGVDPVPGELGAEGRVPGTPVLRRVRVVGSPEPEAVNVDDQAEPSGRAPKRKASSVRGGVAPDGEGAARGKDAGPEGDA